MTFAAAVMLALAVGISIEGWGCLSLYRAGRAYVAGRTDLGRAQARVSGRIAAAGALIALAAWLSAVVAFAPATAASWAVWTAGGVALAAAGGVALLAGLSGKPAPSATFACILCLGGALGVAAPLVRLLGLLATAR